MTQTSAQMGFSAKKLSGRNLADTPASLQRSKFSRGAEKKSIQQRRSTTIRASGRPRHVWSPEAREKALAVRRANALKRREQLQPDKVTPKVEPPTED